MKNCRIVNDQCSLYIETSLLCKSVDWFLNEENIGRYWVKNETRLVSWILEKVIVKLPP